MTMRTAIPDGAAAGVEREPVPPGASASRGRRILAIATNPETGASTRFRVLQWRPDLQRAGFTLSLHAFFSSAAAEVLYQPGRHALKLAHGGAGFIRRVIALHRAACTADLLFVHRETFPLGLKCSFRTLKRFPGPLIYDYDDAMFLPQRQGRGLLSRLEDLETPREIMAISDLVLAGNGMLAEYARRYARRVVLLPTCIDTERFRPRHAETPAAPGGRLTVGWIGSHSTTKYLQSLQPVLQVLARDTGCRFYAVGGSEALQLHGVEAQYARWSLDREVEDFLRCDVGVYPLWNDPWAQGKCGFKAIQFMACGIPVVASAVGVNREIIQDGINGFLAETEEEWVEKLHYLLTDAALRRRMGEAGRTTVETRYSLRANAPVLLSALSQAMEKSGTLP